MKLREHLKNRGKKFVLKSHQGYLCKLFICKLFVDHLNLFSVFTYMSSPEHHLCSDFPAFGLNTGIYFVKLTQSNAGKYGSEKHRIQTLFKQCLCH